MVLISCSIKLLITFIHGSAIKAVYNVTKTLLAWLTAMSNALQCYGFLLLITRSYLEAQAVRAPKCAWGLQYQLYLSDPPE
jgi:hypothetical protein